MRLSLVLLLLLGSACVVVAHPPQPPPRVMPAAEAVATATHYARSHGLVIEHTQRAWLDRRARWHVDLEGAAGRDRAIVVVDGFSGRVLNAKLSGPRGEYAPPPPPVPPGAAPEAAPDMTPEPGTPPPSIPPPPPPPPG